jgi:hypothetical protein
MNRDVKKAVRGMFCSSADGGIGTCEYLEAIEGQKFD